MEWPVFSIHIMRRRLVLFLIPLLAFVLSSSQLLADPVPVKYREGSVHGYLAIRSLDGKILGAADLTQTIRGEVLTSRLLYRFRDGSIDDDTAVFSQQHGVFRLISDHHIQKGPRFPKPMSVMIQATTGEVTVRYKDKDQEKVETTHLDLPPDLANGILLDLLKNISTDTPEIKLSYVVATPKPRLIKISVKPEGQDIFRSAGLRNKAIRFKLHVELGSIAGVVAPIIGKEPPDTRVWISLGEVPAVIRSEQPLYEGGPVLRTELISPIWQTAATAERGSGK